MVRISTNAIALMEKSRRQQGIPESQGVRIYGEDDGAGGLRVRLTFAEDPDEGDELLEEQGTEFYVAPEVMVPLQDTIIDVADEDSEQFALRPDNI